VLLVPRLDEAKADELAAAMTEGRWTHDYPITHEEAAKLGIPVSLNLPEEIYQLMELFPQTAQQRPSVQFVPVPYKRSQQKESGK
jgi:ClpP class serine protease